MCPIYEFCCEECNLVFELLCPMNCHDEVECPECQTETAHKIMSGGQAFDWNGVKPT